MLRLSAPAILALAAFSVGCAGNCTTPHGLFERRAVERAGGTCGAMVEPTLTYGAGVPTACTGTDDLSADMCTTQLDTTCPNGPGSMHTVATIYWSGDGRSATGPQTITVYDAGGAMRCSSTYDVQYTSL